MRRTFIIIGIVLIILVVIITLSDEDGGNLGPMVRALGALLRAF